MRIACVQFGSGTCASAKKNIGDRKKENGIRRSLIVEARSILKGKREVASSNGRIFEPFTIHLTNQSTPQ
jgi:hypothetical protein